MAGLRKHIGTLVFESALIGGGFAAEEMLSQIPGWGWLAYSIIAGVVSIPLIYGSEIKRWWERRKGITPPASPESQPPDLPIAPGPIPPEKTITAHGIVSMGPTGYPEKLTTWDALKRGELAPPPSGPPPRESREEELWKVSPGAGRTIARAIMEAESLDEALPMFDAHYASPNPKDTAWAAYALMKRMEAEEADSTPFVHRLVEDGLDLVDYLEELENDPIFQDKESYDHTRTDSEWDSGPNKPEKLSQRIQYRNLCG